MDTTFKTKQDLTSELLMNNKLDSAFIEKYTVLYTTYAKEMHRELNYPSLYNYSGAQLSAICDFVKKFKDTKKTNMEIAIKTALEVFSTLFNESQIRVITEYLDKVDTKIILKYVDYNIPYAVLHYILLGISEGHNMNKYRNYTPDQLNEIYCGLSQGLDVSYYDNIKFSPSVMGFIRHALVMNLPKTEIEYIVKHFVDTLE